MPKHFISARKKPKAEIKAAPTWYERTHPVGSAERFLDEAAKDALEMAAAGGVPGPKQVIASAAKEVLKGTRYPDPLLEAAAKLPREELMKRAARAEAFQRYMDSQNRAVALASALDSPLGRTATAVAGAELSDRLQTQQDWGGGKNTVHRVEFENTTEKEKERRKAIADAEREAARPRFEARRGPSVPTMTRKQYRELMDGRGGQGDPDAMLGARMNPLVLAAGTTSPAAAAAMTAPAVLKARRDLKEMGVDALSDPDAAFNLAMLGMIVKAPASRVKAAKAMLGGKSWAEAPRALKQKIKLDTGVENYLGTWEKEIPDVKLSRETVQKVLGMRAHDDAVGGTFLRNGKGISGDATALLDLPKGVSEGKLRGRGHMVIDLSSEARRGAIVGEYEPLAPDYGNVTIFGRGLSPEELNRVSVHETQHFLDHVLRGQRNMYSNVPTDAIRRYGDYVGQPTELRAFNAEYRSQFPFETRRGWLLEDSLDDALRSRDPSIFNKGTYRQEMKLQNRKTSGTQLDAKGGDSVSENPEVVSENPEVVSENPEGVSKSAENVSNGPRIVINPTTFRNKKDALCVAFNEGFRLWMEATGFEPQSEPTDAQRRFFSDTAYADDELQLRRTILARIATFDTSVKDPTDDQLAETGSFLDAILESPDWCRNEWERNAVSRLSQAVKASVGAEPVEPKPEPLEARPEEPLQSR